MSSQPAPIHDRAADNLRFIRETMQRAGEFTAVPGWGGTAMGASALIAAFLAQQQTDPSQWLRIWLLELVVAIALASVTMTLKARRARMPLLGGPALRFAMAFTPPVLAGGALTWALATSGNYELLPSVWLLLYGSGILAGGTNSVRVIPIMGLLFFAFGVAAFFGAGNLFLAAGFGGLHLVFGAIIAWRYGG